jgi:hypothetical protein
VTKPEEEQATCTHYRWPLQNVQLGEATDPGVIGLGGSCWGLLQHSVNMYPFPVDIKPNSGLFMSTQQPGEEPDALDTMHWAGHNKQLGEIYSHSDKVAGGSGLVGAIPIIQWQDLGKKD